MAKSARKLDYSPVAQVGVSTANKSNDTFLDVCTHINPSCVAIYVRSEQVDLERYLSSPITHAISILLPIAQRDLSDAVEEILRTHQLLDKQIKIRTSKFDLTQRGVRMYYFPITLEDAIYNIMDMNLDG